jgi:hypothetical protein
MTQVAEAIKHQHRIIQAQRLAFHLVPSNTTNTTLPLSVLETDPDATDAMQVYTGTATTPPGEGRRRVVQDEAATRVLQALLGTTRVLVAVGWVCMRETDVLPRAPDDYCQCGGAFGGGESAAGEGPGRDGRGVRIGGGVVEVVTFLGG